jgi:threonylcarbamoyladenosine tRNA methylthiotransferase MtaB
VCRAREQIPNVALATDIIVGFPGETDAAFERTMEVVRAVSFSKLHVFRYSARPQTAAAERPDTVPPEAKRERSRRLIALGNELRGAWIHNHVGSTLEVLVEDTRVVDDTPVASGQTGDFVRVWFEGAPTLGDTVEVVGERVRSDGLAGRWTGRAG